MQAPTVRSTTAPDTPARAENPQNSRAGTPVHQHVYEALKAQVLHGDLPPGAAVTIKGIADALDAGMTPVREALRRLIAAGALQMQGNRRVSVPVLTAASLDEITHLRLAVEPELARRAAGQAGIADLADLNRIDTQLDRDLSSGNITGYLIQNHAFHDHIYSLAHAPILAETAEGLWLRFGPSMRVICAEGGTNDLPDLHKRMLSAFEAKDGTAAAEAMAADVAQGMEALKAAL